MRRSHNSNYNPKDKSNEEFRAPETNFLIQLGSVKIILIQPREKFIKNLIKIEQDFWENNIRSNVMPEPTGNANETEQLKNMPMAEVVTLDDESAAILDEKSRIDTEIKSLQEQSDILKEKILIKMSENSSDAKTGINTVAECGLWKISLTTQSAKRIDTAALKKAGIYDAYAKESVSRVLRISQIKGA